MTWLIKIDKKVNKDFKKIDKKHQKTITNFLINKLSKLDDPRDIGEALKGTVLGNYWKYRVGNYRIITEIRDTELIIRVIKVGHRKDVYK